MAYAIMRCEKISAKGNLASSISHAYRERETLNADLDRTPENEILVRYDKEQTDNEIESARTRKDNVIMYDMFIGMSPEWAKDVSPAQVSEWKDKSMEWLKEEFGAENIKSAVLHQDEQTPIFKPMSFLGMRVNSMPSTGQEESNAVLNYKIATMQRSKNWGLQGASVAVRHVMRKSANIIQGFMSL